ncbi:MAG: FAD-binding oxidoreductase, partial [Cyclobacteriaceae bacterium]|nr:FAD-binding oxidoreductase [Cyclobacteriaceae bacterium]
MTRRLYSTDASAYREMPLGVCIPESREDITQIVRYAAQHKIPIIPRTAGTSLAGQVVGKGLVVDVSKKFTRIIELNAKEGWVDVEPGVVRDELNMFLKPHGFMFGPETSTANRAMIGGMIGNNSCGSNSVIYGSTRENLLSVEAVLSDGTTVEFKDLSVNEFNNKINSENPLEASLYKQINDMLSSEEVRNNIDEHFPKKSIPRRNT